ncbi:MAG TPA: VOC family protein [Dehalococcoidia bacterium]|jgi:PhnB protein|nr:VOC family protein [Dehalococcoidia bacterium]
MPRLTPYLLFDGNCAEAMRFYQACLGGQLSLTKAGDSPMRAQIPAESHERVVNARLTSGDLEISASDWLHPTRRPRQGNTTCVYISNASYADLQRYFGRLSEGADPDLLDSLTDMPFGSYGALTDKYGVRWMLQGDPAP